MRSFLWLLLLGSLVTVLCATTVSQQAEAPPAHRSKREIARRQNIVGIPNFGEVTSDLYRGGQPTPQGLRTLAKMGVNVIVDIRLTGADRERQEANQLGMQLIALPWHCLFPKDEVFAKFLKLLRDNRGKKVFVHCRYGDDRTGMMIAAYRMAEQGWTPKEAEKEMDKFGFHRTLCPSLVGYEKNFPKRLKKDPVFEGLRASSESKR